MPQVEWTSPRTGAEEKGKASIMTFIVRVSRNESGRIAGVVERVRTGEKERVDGLEAISAAIARMLGANPQGGEQRNGDREGSADIA
jgi:hypothetical protein